MPCEGEIKLLPKPIVGSAGTVTTDNSCTDHDLASIPSEVSSISFIEYPKLIPLKIPSLTSSKISDANLLLEKRILA